MTNRERALQLAKGSFQQALVEGTAYLGGKGLRGKAKQYASSYYHSAYNFLLRLKEAGIPYRIEQGPRGGSFSSKLHILEEGSGNDDKS